MRYPWIGIGTAILAITGIWHTGAGEKSGAKSRTGGDTDLVKHGSEGLKAAVTKVKDKAQALVEAAKGDYPAQTSAITSSVNSLTTLPFA